MNIIKKVMQKIKKDKMIDSELERLLALDEGDEEEMEEEDYRESYEDENEELTKSAGKNLKKKSVNEFETDPEDEPEDKPDKTDLFTNSFESDLIEDLKKEDLSGEEGKYDILKVLDKDVSGDELAKELKEILQEIRQR